jgi:plastocyanin
MMLRRAAFPLAILTGIALFATPADAATVQVSIENHGFNNAIITVVQGDTVTWTQNESGTQHTTTSLQGFWDSGALNLHQTFSETKAFLNAGSYAYRCSIHTDMHGTVQVRMKKKGSAGSGWTVRWSSASSTPAGRNFDVQIKRPGQSGFRSFRSTTTSRTAFFNPATTGTYTFEARTRNTANGLASGWSVPMKLSIS